MPRGDRTGPAGEGAKTGRALGYCSGNESAGFVNPMSGRGRQNFAGGGRRGRKGGFGSWFFGGRGMGRGFQVVKDSSTWGPRAFQMEPSEEAEVLKNEAGFLKNQLEKINERIAKLEKGDES